MDKKWMILIGFLSIITLISSITSSSLVFLNDEAKTEANSQKVLANNNIYKNISINYERSNNIRLSSIQPGYSLEQKFTIDNNGSSTINYNIEWKNISSTWNTGKPDEFTYQLSCTNGENKKESMPVNNDNNIIFENLELVGNSSNNCTIKISFANTGQDQSYNLDKTFGGTYKVVIK